MTSTGLFTTATRETCSSKSRKAGDSPSRAVVDPRSAGKVSGMGLRSPVEECPWLRLYGFTLVNFTINKLLRIFHDGTIMELTLKTIYVSMTCKTSGYGTTTAIGTSWPFTSRGNQTWAFFRG